SESSGPRSCTALGRRRALSPTGTVSPGMPARLAPMVKMSLRYMASGSSTFSPSLNASVGAAGSNITSQRANASSYSLRMRVRAEVVGVVVAGRQRVGAEQDAPLHFRAESRAPRVGVERVHVVAPLMTKAVAHAVEARQVRAGFRGRHQVVRRHRELAGQKI